MTTNSLEKLSNIELAHYAIDVLRRIMLHYGIWFNEVVHQLGWKKLFGLRKRFPPRFSP